MLFTISYLFGLMNGQAFDTSVCATNAISRKVSVLYSFTSGLLITFPMPLQVSCREKVFELVYFSRQLL